MKEKLVSMPDNSKVYTIMRGPTETELFANLAIPPDKRESLNFNIKSVTGKPAYDFMHGTITTHTSDDCSEHNLILTGKTTFGDVPKPHTFIAYYDISNMNGYVIVSENFS